MTAVSYAIRTVRPDDVDAIAAIHAASFDDAWTAVMIRRILTMPGAFGLVAEESASGIVTGFALARIAADECELLSLGVDAGHRGRGTGARLLRAAMAWARAGRADRFFLEVAEDNEVALRLYRAHGLAPVGRRPGYYELKGGGQMAALTMRRGLADFDDDGIAVIAGRTGVSRPS